MSKYFELQEMYASYTAKVKGIDNIPKDKEINDNLIRLMDVLDLVRDFLGRPLKLSNAYRCEALNALVGGVKGSKHTQGLAADMLATPEEQDKLMKWLKNKQFYNTAIVYPSRGFVHIDIPSAGENPKTKRLASKLKGVYVNYDS